MDGGAEIGNSGRRGLYRANQLARAAVHALSSHLTNPVPLSVRQSWLSRARRTHSQALHPAQLRMGLAALARGERRMMPLGMVPYLLWPTRTALPTGPPQGPARTRASPPPSMYSRGTVRVWDHARHVSTQCMRARARRCVTADWAAAPRARSRDRSRYCPSSRRRT